MDLLRAWFSEVPGRLKQRGLAYAGMIGVMYDRAAMADHGLRPWDALRFSSVMGRSACGPLLGAALAFGVLSTALSCAPLIGPLLWMGAQMARPIITHEDLMSRESTRIRLEAAGLMTRQGA